MNPGRPAHAEDFGRTRLDALTSGIADVAVEPEWAWAGGTGKGIRVGIIDSGIDADHPAIDGRVVEWVSFGFGPEGQRVVDTAPHGDEFGHGTACAGIVRQFAPEADLVSIKVLGTGGQGRAANFIEGLRWAIDRRIPVLNLSLGTSVAEYETIFYQLCDEAYFRRIVLVTAANNVPVDSFPSLYASVFSVACHAGRDPYEFYYNPTPPPEFGAPGIDIEVAWTDKGTLRATGNSFAAPHVAGLAARILGKHPRLRPFEVKAILRSTARNVRDKTPSRSTNPDKEAS